MITSIKSDITRGLQITAELDRLKAELKGIEQRVEAAALEADHIPLGDADREGRQAILSNGEVSIPVIFESDLVAASLPDSGPAMQTIRDLLGDDEHKLCLIWRETGGPGIDSIMQTSETLHCNINRSKKLRTHLQIIRIVVDHADKMRHHITLHSLRNI